MSNIFNKPTGKGARNVQDNKRENGRVINPPRYAQMGGLTGPSKMKMNADGMKIKKPNV
jgi:hypothetical protein